MEKIRAVLFDFGGTLYDYRSLASGDAEALAILAAELGIDAPASELARAQRDGLRASFEKHFPKPYYDHRDLFGDAVRHMVESFGASVSEGQLRAYLARQWAFHARDFRLREGVPETLEELRARGLHLGIVSNIDDDQLAHLGALAGLPDRFDSVLSSEAVRSCKPDSRIFEAALERAGCSPEEALFVGDSIDADVAGANRIGCVSVLLWHRQDLPVPDRDPRPAHVIRRIPDLLDLFDGGVS